MDTCEQWVTVRNLVWQGYLAFQKLGTQEFGGVYLGNGVKQADVPFYLWLSLIWWLLNKARVFIEDIIFLSVFANLNDKIYFLV